MVDFVEHKLLQGADAGRWLPFARQKVAILHARVRAMGVTTLVQRYVLEGGMAEVTIRVVGDQLYIHILRKQCPLFLSGFIDLQGFLGACTFIVPNLTPPPDTIEVLRRFFPSPAQTEPSRVFRDESGLINSGPQIGGCGDVTSTRASNFSGEMRKVVQILQGADIAVEYRYVAAVTHGVFKTENGSRWVIEISNQGVAAWIMGICQTAIVSRDGEPLLDYTPLHTPKPTGDALVAARVAGTFLDLLPAAGVQDFYTKDMYFSACGWAFSGDGHEAANVCVGADSNARIGFLYKIQIIEIANRPVSATLAEASRGYLAIGTDRTHMKFPVAAGDPRLFSYDTGAYLPVNTDAPIYCYYEGFTLQVFRVVFSYGGNTLTGNEETPCCGVIGPQVPPNDSGASYRVSGTFSFSEVPHFVGGASNNPSVLNESSISGTTRTRFADTTPLGVGTLGTACIQNHGLQFRVSGSQSSVTGAELVANVFAVPAYDREAVYIGGKLDGTGLVRTAYSAFDAVNDQQVIDCNTGASSNALYTTVPLECCTTNPTHGVLVGLGASPATGALRCANGSRVFSYAGCAGNIPFFPFAEQIAVGIQDGGTCNDLGLPNRSGSFTCNGYTDNNPVAFSPTSSSTIYIASGNVSTSLSPRVAQNVFESDFYKFSEGLIALISIRDAFDGGKYIISSDQGKFLGSDCLSTATDYPVAEASAVMAFVGVP